MSLTQTVGSSSCVLPEWSPEVLNSILSCYSFCKDVEKLSSGTTFSISFTVPSRFHSCRILTEARYLCQAPPLWLVLFFSGSERYPVDEECIYTARLVAWLTRWHCWFVCIVRSKPIWPHTIFNSMVCFWKWLLFVIDFVTKKLQTCKNTDIVHVKISIMCGWVITVIQIAKQNKGKDLRWLLHWKMDYLNSSPIDPIKCWEHTYILLVNCVAWGMQQMHRLSSIYIIKEHGNMKNKCHYLCLRFFFWSFSCPLGLSVLTWANTVVARSV